MIEAANFVPSVKKKKEEKSDIKNKKNSKRVSTIKQNFKLDKKWNNQQKNQLKDEKDLEEKSKKKLMVLSQYQTHLNRKREPITTAPCAY